MKEIEIKILNIDRKNVEKRIIELGADKIFDGIVETTYFDYSDSSINKKNRVIRLRVLGGKTFLTIKLPNSSNGKENEKNNPVKNREEYEVMVSNFEDMKTILLSFGLNETLKVKKHRTSYLVKNDVGNTRFEFDKHLDEFKFIAEFMEIESVDRKTIYEYVDKLKLEKDKCKPWNFRELVKYYKK